MSGPVPLELQSKIASWRLRAADGTLSLEEMKEGIVYLRAGRLAASIASVKKKPKAVAPSAGDMLDELNDL